MPRDTTDLIAGEEGECLHNLFIIAQSKTDATVIVILFQRSTDVKTYAASLHRRSQLSNKCATELTVYAKMHA